LYRFDPRDRRKQRIATDLLRAGIATDSIRVAHQALVEFYAAVTRPLPGFGPLLEPQDARRETEEMFAQFVILFPDEAVARAALRATAAYRRMYGSVRMRPRSLSNRIEQVFSRPLTYSTLDLSDHAQRMLTCDAHDRMLRTWEK